MKLPRSFYSWTSISGAALAFISLMMIIFMMILDFVIGRGDNYSGLFTYIVLPVFLIIGLILIPVGAIRKIRDAKKYKDEPEPPTKFPVVNLNEPSQRTALIVFIIGSTIFLLLSAVGSYEAFHYTESVPFCGTLCHEVMKPEYVAYQNSAHARVACVDCHVGPGAGWYVKSKLSGMYQVYAVLTNSYPTPIPTPISNLRPARETCEECHWPEQFYSRKLRTEKHYLADETNTEWDISQQMKIGATYKALGLVEGIHWHINQNVKIEYVVSGDREEIIPWIRYTNLKTGKVKVFQSPDTTIDISQTDSKNIHVMDCMNCHNRPSHNYQPPQLFVDNALTNGEIPKTLPNIKAAAMQVLNVDYGTTDSATMLIRSGIFSYYESKYPEVFNSQKADIEKAVVGILAGFNKNIFPEMKVKWSAYPIHLGHKTSDGCFRCHNQQHSTADGETISRDCNLCHIFVAQGTPGSMEAAMAGDSLEFKHPVDIDDAWKTELCSTCHAELY
jgi:hypothetical protein